MAPRVDVGFCCTRMQTVLRARVQVRNFLFLEVILEQQQEPGKVQRQEHRYMVYRHLAAVESGSSDGKECAV